MIVPTPPRLASAEIATIVHEETRTTCSIGPGMNDHPDRQLNIAHWLPERAAEFADKKAVVYPARRDRNGRVVYTQLTFRELNERADGFAHGLAKAGIARGMRTLLMVRPNLDFSALTFALFKIGAVPVMIDPGMGWRNFMRCVAQVEPEGFLGIPAAHVLRLLFPRYFRSVRIPVTLGRRWFWGGCGLRNLAVHSGPFPAAGTGADETAAILFTTGSTGPAKGVVYTHGIFESQVRVLRDYYGLTPDNVDLPCFPLFGLFSTALGVTAVIPDMDPSRPAYVNPERIIEAVRDHGVTYSFGSPALWRTVSAHCVEAGVRLPTLRRIFMAGAPVPAYLHDRLLNHILPPGGETHTPYGATEALPVSSFTGSEMLAETQERTVRGEGVCVGRPVAGVDLRIIGISDDPISTWDDALVLPRGETGEITVSGPMVTPAYFGLPRHTELAKIGDGNRLWHRMGDVGYIDEDGRIWVCGRKGHRVITPHGTMFTVCCEAIFNTHDKVYRSALVGVGEDRQAQTPVLVAEPEPGCFPGTGAARTRLADELLELGRASPLTRSIARVLFRRAFPVDVRHNAKIRREELAGWAARQLRSGV